MRTRGVRYLLMGGQACVLYGAAEFSRDTDLAVLADAENLRRLAAALDDLGASVIAVPPFEARYLERGHAVHFACAAAGGMRVDVMTQMRNVPPFDECWARRSTYALPDVGDVEVLGLEDLVRCKKTRRDKDWPMVRRLVEANYIEATAPGDPIGVTAGRVAFWLRELRTPALLREAAARAAAGPPYQALLAGAADSRPACVKSQQFTDLVAVLREPFQLDQPDLDFGIYRVLHARSAEITAFLEQDLLPQVRAASDEYRPADKAAIERELNEPTAQLRGHGVDPDTSPKRR